MPANKVWAWYVFKYKPLDFFVNWKEFAHCTIAVTRAHYGKHLATDAAEGAKLVEELSAESIEFRDWWTQHDVLDTPHPHKEFVYPMRGRLIYHSSSFQPNSLPDVRSDVYAPLDELDQIVFD